MRPVFFTKIQPISITKVLFIGQTFLYNIITIRKGG